MFMNLRLLFLLLAERILWRSHQKVVDLLFVKLQIGNSYHEFFLLGGLFDALKDIVDGPRHYSREVPVFVTIHCKCFSCSCLSIGK